MVAKASIWVIGSPNRYGRVSGRRSPPSPVCGVRCWPKPPLLQVVEDQLQRLLADLLLAAGGERVAVAVALDDRLMLELLAELVQIEALVDEAAALQVLHPLQHLVHIAARLQQQEVEQVHEVGEVLQRGG